MDEATKEFIVWVLVPLGVFLGGQLMLMLSVLGFVLLVLYLTKRR